MLTLLPYVVVAVLSAAAVLHHGFNDSLTQRIGLSLMSFGASLKVVALVNHQPGANESCTILAYGVSVFFIGTIIELRRLKML